MRVLGRGAPDAFGGAFEVGHQPVEILGDAGELRDAVALGEGAFAEAALAHVAGDAAEVAQAAPQAERDRPCG
jgi:hypothetical protein